MGQTLDLEMTAGVARVTMHRGSNNAIAPDLLGELEECFGGLGSDPHCRVVILQSAHEKYFSVGADLSLMASIDRLAPDAEDRVIAQVVANARAFAAIEACPKPVIASLGGHALGGGCELALCCDYRLMVDDGRALIGQTEASLGLIPGGGATQRLVRLIGRARALPMLIEATRLGAPAAAAAGLVDLALRPEDFEARVQALAERLAGAATLAVGLIKEAVNKGSASGLEEGLRTEARNFARAALSQDAAVGLMSFLARQEPQFTGE